MARNLSPVVLCVLLLARVVSAQENDPVLRHYINLALNQNPVISAAQNRLDAAHQKIPQAGALTDPMLGLGIREYPLSGDGNDRLKTSGKWISLEQQFPWPGTRRAERSAATAARDEQTAMLDADKNMLVLDIRTMYYEWQRVRAERALVDSTRTLLNQMLAQAQSAYSAGRTDLSELLRVQTELTKLDAMIADLAAMEKKVVAEINICCQIPPDSMTTPPSPLTDERYEFDKDSVYAAMAEHNPNLRAAAERKRMAQSEVFVARKMGLPMWSLGLEYMRRNSLMTELGEHGATQSWEPDHMISVMGGITLPVYRKQKQSRLVDQRRSEFMQSGDEYDVLYNDTRLGATRAVADLQALREQIDLYQTSILPQTRMTLDAALAGYVQGRVDFSALLLSEMNWFEQQRTTVTKIAEYKIVWSKVLALVGDIPDEE